MSNLMDKISNKLSGNDLETQNQGFSDQNSQGGRPSSNTRSNQRGGMGQQDQTYATQDQQGWDQSGPQGYGSNQQSGGFADLNTQQGLQQGQQADQQAFGGGNQGLKGNKNQSSGMYDEDPTSSGGRKAGTHQQGVGNTGGTNQVFTQSGEPLGSQFEDDIQGNQQQFQRRF